MLSHRRGFKNSKQYPQLLFVAMCAARARLHLRVNMHACLRGFDRY